MKTLLIIFTLVFTVMFSSSSFADVSSVSVFTLYRNNHSNPAARVHIATFDTKNGGQYNELHCNKAVKYFRSDAKSRGSDERFWCEKGYVKK